MTRFPKIFISYHRDDTSGFAGRLYADLKRLFGAENVFRDRETIPGGTQWEKEIKAHIDAADVMLAVIGTEWAARVEATENVRSEIVTALARGEDIVVMPVLVEGVKLSSIGVVPPDVAPLFKRQGPELSDELWEESVDRLLDDIDGALGKTGKGNLVSTGGLRLIKAIPASALVPQRSKMPSFLYSFIFGSIGGLLMGWIFGAMSALPRSSIFWVALFGLSAGALFSIGINLGMDKFSKWFSNSAPVIIIGAGVGGGIFGVSWAVITGLFFVWKPEDPPDSQLLVYTVATATIFIIMGILFPDLKTTWQWILSIIAAAIPTLVVLAISTSLIQLWKLNSTTKIGVVLVGSMSGLMSGLEASGAIVLYSRLQRWSTSS